MVKHVQLSKFEVSFLLLCVGIPIVEIFLSFGKSTLWYSILMKKSVLAFLITAPTVWYFFYHINLKSLPGNSHAKSSEHVKTVITKKNSQILEICVSDIESIENCRKGGADSIEICIDRTNGGLSPSIGLIEEAVNILRSTDIQIHVLIRPRPGNFVYSHTEFDVIIREVIALRNIGVHGIVVGFLDKLGYIDVGKLQVIRRLSHGLILTFHRAFDMSAEDPLDALNTIIQCGCDRVLTSGRCKDAGSIEGIEALRQLTDHAHGRIQIIAGGGVKLNNMEDILFAGVSGVHTGSSVTTNKCVERPHTLPHTLSDTTASSMSNKSNKPPGVTLSNMTEKNSSKKEINANNKNAAVIGLGASEDLNTWDIVDSELVCAFADHLATISSNTESWRPSHINGTSTNKSSVSISSQTNLTAATSSYINHNPNINSNKSSLSAKASSSTITPSYLGSENSSTLDHIDVNNGDQSG